MSSEVARNSVEKYRQYVDGLSVGGTKDAKMHIIKISDEIQIEAQVVSDGHWVGECSALGISVTGKDHDAVMNNIMEALALSAREAQKKLEQSEHNLQVLRDAYRNVSYDQQSLIEGLVKTNSKLRNKLDNLCRESDFKKS